MSIQPKENARKTSKDLQAQLGRKTLGVAESGNGAGLLLVLGRSNNLNNSVVGTPETNTLYYFFHSRNAGFCHFSQSYHDIEDREHTVELQWLEH